jgi:hypothetical protein
MAGKRRTVKETESGNGKKPSHFGRLRLVGCWARRFGQARAVVAKGADLPI